MIVEGSSEDSEKSDEKDQCFMDDIVDPNLIFSYDNYTWQNNKFKNWLKVSKESFESQLPHLKLFQKEFFLFCDQRVAFDRPEFELAFIAFS